MVVYKYELQQGIETEIFTYRNGKVLGAGEQNGNIVIWIAVDISEAPTIRSFLIINTGEFSQGQVLAYVGTVQKANGYVKHVFEVL